MAGVAGDVGLESMSTPQFRGADVGHCCYSPGLADFVNDVSDVGLWKLGTICFS